MLAVRNIRFAYRGRKVLDGAELALSPGERVCLLGELTLIARALAQEARLLVMDAPLIGLDHGHQVRAWRDSRPRATACS